MATRNLQNKTVVIVGGTSGIGFAVALAALQSLASVVIVASSSASRVSNAVERLRAHNLPGEVRGEVLNAKNADAVKDFAVSLGTVDHVAWTAGDTTWNDGSSDSDGAVRADPLAAALSVRFWGPYLLAQSVKFAPGGSLTVTTGSGDIKPSPGLTISAGATAAIVGLSRGLAVDLAPIRVNVVSPGGVNTESWDHFPAAIVESFRQTMKDGLLIKRFGEPDEVADAYIFLMTCGYITGQRINIDGGIELA